MSRFIVLPLLAALLTGAAPAAAATVFITNTKSDSVSIIDTDTLEVVGTIPLGKGKPKGKPKAGGLKGRKIGAKTRRAATR